MYGAVAKRLMYGFTEEVAEMFRKFHGEARIDFSWSCESGIFFAICGQENE